MELLHTAKSGYEGVMSAFMKVGALNVEHLEKLTEKQLDTAQYYADLSITQLKEMQSIDSLDGFKKLTSDSMENSNKIAKKMLEDSKDMASMGSAYKDSFMEIVKSISAKESADK